jgi:hypothetical protein
MSLAAQIGVVASSVAVPPATEQSSLALLRPTATLRLGLALFGATLLALFAAAAGQAGDLAPYLEAAGSGPLLAYASTTLIQRAPTALQVATDPDVPQLVDRISVPNEGETKALSLSLTPATDAQADPDIELLHTRMQSRYAYDSWAVVQAGYGQFFPDDKIGRSRISGAGLKEKDWFYLKVSFRF